MQQGGLAHLGGSASVVGGPGLLRVGTVGGSKCLLGLGVGSPLQAAKAKLSSHRTHSAGRSAAFRHSLMAPHFCCAWARAPTAGGDEETWAHT